MSSVTSWRQLDGAPFYARALEDSQASTHVCLQLDFVMLLFVFHLSFYCAGFAGDAARTVKEF